MDDKANRALGAAAGAADIAAGATLMAGAPVTAVVGGALFITALGFGATLFGLYMIGAALGIYPGKDRF